MELKRFIVHELQKKKTDKNTQFIQTIEELDINDTEVINLTSELHQHISVSNKKVYGKFSNQAAPQDSSYFTQHFFKYAASKRPAQYDLLSMTVDVTGGGSTQSLKSIMDSVPQTTGGYILYIDYIESDTNYFIVCMLNNKNGRAITISDGKATVYPTHILNLKDLDIACRIDKNKIHSTETPPLIFITAKKSNHYFAKFIGCTDFLNADDNSKALAEILDRIIEESDENEINKDVLRQKVKDYVDMRVSLKDEVLDIGDMSVYFFGEENRDFVMKKAEEYGIKVDTYFSPSKSKFDIIIKVSLDGDWSKMEFRKDKLKEEFIDFPDDTSVLIRDASLARKIREKMGRN